MDTDCFQAARCPDATALWDVRSRGLVGIIRGMKWICKITGSSWLFLTPAVCITYWVNFPQAPNPMDICS